MKIVRWMGGMVWVAALAACSGQEQAPQAAVPVLVVHPGEQAGQAPAAFPGTVRARQESPLSFRVGGNLVKRHVDAGQRVKKGDVLAELDVADFALQARASQAQLAAAEADLVRARDDLKRYQVLADQQLVSRSQLDQQSAAFKAAQGQANAARANLDVLRNQADYAQLRAPADGVIASREAEAGQVVSAGQTIFNLAADGGREVLIDLPEATIRDYAVGQPVEVELWNRPASACQARSARSPLPPIHRHAPMQPGSACPPMRWPMSNWARARASTAAPAATAPCSCRSVRCSAVPTVPPACGWSIRPTAR